MLVRRGEQVLGIIEVVFFQAQEGIRKLVQSRGLGDVCKREREREREGEGRERERERHTHRHRHTHTHTHALSLLSFIHI